MRVCDVCSQKEVSAVKLYIDDHYISGEVCKKHSEEIRILISKFMQGYEIHYQGNHND